MMSLFVFESHNRDVIRANLLEIVYRRTRPTTQRRKRGVRVIMGPVEERNPWCVILSTIFFPLFSDSLLQARVFSYIPNFDQTITRKFQKTNGMLKADEPHIRLPELQS